MARNRRVLAFIVSAGLAAAIWFLSIPITGESEPWDAAGPFYEIALAVAGAISGAIVPKHFGAHYAGAFLGQAGYELAFLKLGPLFVLGLAFLAAYSLVFFAAAVLAGAFRTHGSDEASAQPPGTP